jgi:hypothetical protein
LSDSEARPYDWFSIRSWAGSQDRAFEELCYQLRDVSEPGWQTIKTAAPDGGVEWYDKAADGRCHGHQVKYVHDVDGLLPQARKSLAAVGRNRPDRDVVRMTFWVPIDLPDPAHRVNGKPVEGARKRWNDAVASRKRDLPGTADIEIYLVDSGQLLDRLSKPGNEGRQWFFFEQHALGMDWLRDKLQVAEGIAHDRYTPQHHVPLPVASIVDGCAVSSSFLDQLRRSAAAASKAVPGVMPLQQAQPSGLAGDEARSFAKEHATLFSYLERAQQNAAELQAVAREAGAAMMPAMSMAEAAAEIRGLLSYAREAGQHLAELSDQAARQSAPEAGTNSQGPNGWTRSDVYRIEAAGREVERFEAMCRSDAGLAAEAKVWVLLGEAGQGKTHLLVDATKRALAEGRPSVTVFGEQLNAVDPLTQIGAQLGLGFLPHRTLLQAMDAAGALSGARFTLIIDALNDSNNPDGWRSALPALVAEAEPYEYVAVVVSCRSSLRQAVLPGDLPERGYPVTIHPGFAGHEVEGLEKYLQKAPSALPRTPMLTPAFSSPLFVKLYSDSLLSFPAARREAGTVPHRGRVFDAFLDRRATQIDTHLGLDPAQRSVHRAVQELASFMAAQGGEVVSRDQARILVDRFAPAALSWPNTMLGQLVAHGVLATDRYVRTDGRWENGIGFAYQAFSDDRIVRAVLERHQEELAISASVGHLQVGSPLHAWLTAASANLVDAATVLLPETTGRELIDLLHPDDVTTALTDADSRHRLLCRSLVHTLGLREASHVTERTVGLLNHASAVFGMEDDVLEAVLTVTAQPGHCLNADRLHLNLMAHSPSERDMWWGMGVYFLLDDTSALHRLLRWAEQLPTPVDVRPQPQTASRWIVRRPGMPRPSTPATGPQPPAEEVVRLAAVTLVWTLTSPNRFLRDRATKALVQLLLGFPAVLTGLLERFLKQDAQQVNDPYLFERLILVAYGVLARARAHQTRPDLLQHVARTLLECVYGDRAHAAHASKNALLCGAAVRIVKMAHRSGLVTDLDEALTHHPHPCPAPGDAPDKDAIDTQYPSKGAGEEPGWGSLRASLLGLADFVSYEVRPAVDHFSRLPLSTPMPAPVDSAPLLPDALQAFRESLPEAVRNVLGTPEGARRLLRETWRAKRCLDDEQQRRLQACAPAPTRDQQLADAAIDEEWAARWILHNAAQRGWSPEKFAQFDTLHGHGRGRESHKAERFGKKYQWLAFHELVERLANHQHMKPGPRADFTSYPGPDPLFLTDIDPTLPPAAHPLSVLEDSDRDDRHLATFPSSALDGCWNPPTPFLPDRDGLDDWIAGTEQLPDLTRMGLRTIDAIGWVVLNEYVSDHTGGTDWNGQAEQWHLLHSWLVEKKHFPQALAFLADKTLMGRWMPESREWHNVFLADLPLPEVEDACCELHFVDYDAAQEQNPPAPQKGTQPQSGADSPPHTDEIADLLMHYTTGRRQQPPLTKEDQLKNLENLADHWSSAPSVEPARQAAHHSRTARAADGMALQAVPTIQEYSWSASGRDCSLDAPAHLNLPCTRLLTGTDLQRHPDNGDWYTPNGQAVVRALRGYRPTGSVTTLLIRHDWLQKRLQVLDMRLVVGLFGERQPRSTDRLRTWREFSQTAGLQPQGHLESTPFITKVRHTQGD